MKYLTREELVKALEGAAVPLDRYKRCVQDRAGKGLEPRDALALSHILVVEKTKQTHALVHQFAHTLSEATSDYKTVRAEWSGLDEYIQISELQSSFILAGVSRSIERQLRSSRKQLNW